MGAKGRCLRVGLNGLHKSIRSAAADEGRGQDPQRAPPTQPGRRAKRTHTRELRDIISPANDLRRRGARRPYPRQQHPLSWGSGARVPESAEGKREKSVIPITAISAKRDTERLS